MHAAPLLEPDRFFAAPGTKAYGAVSVLVQLAAERTGFHPVARTVFRPRPNVDSALVAFRRRPLPADFPAVKRVVTAAFAHSALELRHQITADRLTTIAVGFVMAFISSALVVKPFLNIVRRRGFAPFAWYRIVVGVALLAAVRWGYL